MIISSIIACVGVLLIYATLEYSLLIPSKKGLPILMYHRISKTESNDLTVTLEALDQHFAYIKQQSYQCLSFAQINEMRSKAQPIPRRSVVITFDDGYQNNYEYLIPLLEKYGMKATIFLPLSHLGKTNTWDQGDDSLMSVDTVKEISKLSFIELGIHSFAHNNYKHISIEEIDQDLRQCEEFLKHHQIDAVRVMAYPYGGTKRKQPDLNAQMKALLSKYGYWFGLRIGNRINKPVLDNPFELYRIDIKGTDRFFEFKIKMKKGRTKLF